MDLSMKRETLPKALREKQTPFEHYLLVSGAGLAMAGGGGGGGGAAGSSGRRGEGPARRGAARLGAVLARRQKRGQGGKSADGGEESGTLAKERSPPRR